MSISGAGSHQPGTGQAPGAPVLCLPPLPALTRRLPRLHAGLCTHTFHQRKHTEFGVCPGQAVPPHKLACPSVEGWLPSSARPYDKQGRASTAAPMAKGSPPGAPGAAPRPPPPGATPGLPPRAPPRRRSTEGDAPPRRRPAASTGSRSSASCSSASCARCGGHSRRRRSAPCGALEPASSAARHPDGSRGCAKGGLSWSGLPAAVKGCAVGAPASPSPRGSAPGRRTGPPSGPTRSAAAPAAQMRAAARGERAVSSGGRQLSRRGGFLHSAQRSWSGGAAGRPGNASTWLQACRRLDISCQPQRHRWVPILWDRRGARGRCRTARSAGSRPRARCLPGPTPARARPAGAPARPPRAA